MPRDFRRSSGHVFPPSRRGETSAPGVPGESNLYGWRMEKVKKQTPKSRSRVVKEHEQSLPTTSISEATVLCLEIDYPYVSGNRAVRHGPKAHRTNPLAKQYYQMVAHQVRSKGMALRLAGPLRVAFELFPPNLAARDADNAMKTIKDALTKAQFWVDDSNKVIRAGSWEWGARAEDEPARVVVAVRGYAP